MTKLGNNMYKLVSREARSAPTLIRIGETIIGSGYFTVMAGPCSVESETQIFSIAKSVSAAGATVLRGGAFKPRTSPYEFQGLGKEGLCYLRAAANEYGLLAVSEVMDTADLSLVSNYVDIIQIGSRNMHNYSLLKQAGKINKPILLKRGLSATYHEWLMAAEYIMQAGNPNIILCERGIRTFETHTRNTLDLAAVPALHELTHLPVIVDPSHGTGLRSLVPSMAYAAFAVGAEGLMVEVHPYPDQSWSDAKQTISPEVFGLMMKRIRTMQSIFRDEHALPC